MKNLKFIFIPVVLFLLAVFVSNCNNNDVVTNSESNFQSDVPNEEVVLYINEYVKVTPNHEEIYYEWRPAFCYVACTSGVGGCFPGDHIDSVLTPEASRYEGTDLVETQYFKISNNSYAHCRDGEWTSFFYVHKKFGPNYFLDVSKPLYENGTLCPEDTTYTDSYSNTTSNVNLPGNTYITILVSMQPLVK